jgi:hypothetical protein
VKSAILWPLLVALLVKRVRTLQFLSFLMARLLEDVVENQWEGSHLSE